jgi:hypothetical protein
MMFKELGRGGGGQQLTISFPQRKETPTSKSEPNAK